MREDPPLLTAGRSLPSPGHRAILALPRSYPLKRAGGTWFSCRRGARTCAGDPGFSSAWRRRGWAALPSDGPLPRSRRKAALSPPRSKPGGRPTASCGSSPSGPIRTMRRYACGGAAMLWSALGHHVKLVSVTNGDIGHTRMGGRPLAQRRTAEVQAASKVLGTTSQVLDIHDGELMPTLENRRTLTRVIREWNADVVHRPPAQRLPSGPPLRGRAGAGCGVHGDGAVLLPRHAVPGAQPGVPLLLRRLPAAQPVPRRTSWCRSTA